ncbi:MAG: hypothetical protein ACI8UO_000364 [Verrucomicrobiales bacterium]|jgi:hypothetical protein
MHRIFYFFRFVSHRAARFRFQGLEQRLTGVEESRVVSEILAVPGIGLGFGSDFRHHRLTRRQQLLTQ